MTSLPSGRENKEEKKMFDKFGEFDSVEELNRAAAGFLTEGDLDSLRKLAEEIRAKKVSVMSGGAKV